MEFDDPKPCPYCGGRAYIDFFGHPHVRAFHTKKCKVRPSTFLLGNMSLKKQIKAWNLRPKED